MAEPVFQTNDAAKRDEQDYCPNRLSIVEMDPYVLFTWNSISPYEYFFVLHLHMHHLYGGIMILIMLPTLLSPS